MGRRRPAAHMLNQRVERLLAKLAIILGRREISPLLIAQACGSSRLLRDGKTEKQLNDDGVHSRILRTADAPTYSHHP